MSSISIFQFEQRETKQAAVLKMYNIKFYMLHNRQQYSRDQRLESVMASKRSPCHSLNIGT